MPFILTNISGSSQGPLGFITQVTIVASGTYTVSDALLSDFQFDPSTRLAIANDLITITVGSVVLSEQNALTYLTSAVTPVVEDSTGINQDLLVKYHINDEDSLSTTKYYGFTTSTSASLWYILQINNFAYRWANISNNATYTSYGSGGASDPWTNRASLSYTYFFNLTGL